MEEGRGTSEEAPWAAPCCKAAPRPTHLLRLPAAAPRRLGARFVGPAAPAALVAACRRRTLRALHGHRDGLKPLFDGLQGGMGRTGHEMGASMLLA